MPLCLTDSCDCLINKRVNSCFAGSRMGFLEFTGSGALFSLALHLIRPLSKNNPNCVTYVGGVDLWSLLRRNAISLKKNDPWTDWIQQRSASFNSTALNVNCSFSAIFTLATWFLKDLAALITRAVTRSNFVRLQNRLISTIWSMFLSGRLAEVLTSEWTVARGLLTTSLSATSSSDWVVRFSGHSVSGRYRNCRPFHHVLIQQTRQLDWDKYIWTVLFLNLNSKTITRSNVTCQILSQILGHQGLQWSCLLWPRGPELVSAGLETLNYWIKLTVLI